MKTCTKCRKRKPETEFYRSRQTKDGLRHACKLCENAARADYQKWGPLQRQTHRGTNRRSPQRLVAHYGLKEADMRAVDACLRALGGMTRITPYQIALDAADDEYTQLGILACAIAFHREEEAVA